MHYAIDRAPEGNLLQFSIEAKRSTFTVRAFAAGLLASFGHNPTIAIPDIEGEVLLNPNAIEQSSLRVVAYSASLNVTDDISAKDRDEINRKMHQEVLESDAFPGIEYKSSHLSVSKTGEGQYWVAITGSLTLHGVTRSLPISARLAINGTTLRATGEFSVRQSDYEIRPVSAVGGTVKLKDELKFAFDIGARKQA